jgi:hypothetical protein
MSILLLFAMLLVICCSKAPCVYVIEINVTCIVLYVCFALFPFFFLIFLWFFFGYSFLFSNMKDCLKPFITSDTSFFVVSFFHYRLLFFSWLNKNTELFFFLKLKPLLHFSFVLYLVFPSTCKVTSCFFGFSLGLLQSWWSSA